MNEIVDNDEDGNEPTRIDLDILNFKPPQQKAESKMIISNEVFRNGNNCTWKGILKLSKDNHSRYDAAINEILKNIPLSEGYSFWPLSYLTSIRAEPGYPSRNGLGTLGIIDFERKSKSLGAKIMIARLYDEETPDCVLYKFYKKNKWTIIKRHPPTNMIAYKLIP